MIRQLKNVSLFSVSRFGSAKMSDAAVVGILVQLVRCFDILVVQEVVDVSNKAINQLLEAVNGEAGDTGGCSNIFIPISVVDPDPARMNCLVPVL